MSALAEKLRRARESSVEVDGHRFTVRRPTDAEAVTLGACTPLELVRQFVVGWNLREIDLIPGGSPVEAVFTADLWAEYVADQPQLWGPLSQEILEAYGRHASARETAEKN